MTGENDSDEILTQGFELSKGCPLLIYADGMAAALGFGKSCGETAPCWHHTWISRPVSGSNPLSSQRTRQWETESLRGGQNNPASGMI
jgi:hypothetical protein